MQPRRRARDATSPCCRLPDLCEPLDTQPASEAGRCNRLMQPTHATDSSTRSASTTTGESTQTEGTTTSQTADAARERAACPLSAWGLVTLDHFAVAQLVTRAAVRAACFAVRNVDKDARMRAPTRHGRVRAVRREVLCREFDQRHFLDIAHKTFSLYAGCVRCAPRAGPLPWEPRQRGVRRNAR